MKKYLYILLAAGLLCACGKPASKSAEVPSSAAFSADSAYAYVAHQVSLGARVPGTPAHEACAKYLREELRRFGAEVHIQQGQLPNYAGQQQQIYNIQGSFRPEANKRVLLCAHWDCRPWSDQESDTEAVMTPVLGANDGASGVGVLLEIARQLGMTDSLPLGVDIVFFDAEDMGTPDFYEGPERENTWCLGSQLWAKEMKPQSGRYAYGILLDMVGAPNAIFPREYYSAHYAPSVLAKIWNMASQLGFGNYFVQVESYPLVDDHLYVNTLAGIPCVDIIHYDQLSGTGFPAYWHTNHDDMSNVSPATLNAVGRTVLTTILH